VAGFVPEPARVGPAAGGGEAVGLLVEGMRPGELTAGLEVSSLRGVSGFVESGAPARALFSSLGFFSHYYSSFVV